MTGRHPHILLTNDGESSLPSVDAMRKAVHRSGPRSKLWETVRAQSEARLGTAPITSFDPLPHRSDEDVRVGNRDYIVVDAAGQRITTAALCALLTQDRRFVDDALRQMESLFDASQWQEWQDIFHRGKFDLDADLRTGQLCRDLGLAFDWMYGLLSADERRWIVEGIDRCGIQPYLRAVAAGAWWVPRMNNWTTVIVGGLGMCGMALGDSHPQSTELVDMSRDRMLQYLDHYGPDGEFNENPAYANSSFLPALYFSSLRFHDRANDIPAPIAALRRHAYWCLYATAPPGHIVSFGDGGPGYPALTSFVPAVAAATADPVLQWFYLQHCEPPRFPVWELLSLDDDLQPEEPTPEILPLGRAFSAHSGLISSRTSWDPATTACVVFGKAGHGGVNHTHPDGGQIEIHGYSERLIVDLGAVGYPAENKHRYYHFSSEGHNQLTIGGRAQHWERDGSHRAHCVASDFDNSRGGWWQIDLTELHEGVHQVTRTVVHLHPGIVVVVDATQLHTTEVCRLRWHPAQAVEASGTGQFSLVSGTARLDAWVGLAMGSPLDLTPGRHAYQAPFDRDRMDNLLPQRQEPYVDATVQADEVCFVSLFAVSAETELSVGWERGESGWRRGDVSVTVGDEYIQVASSEVAWEVSRRNAP
jgi:hypothetical protein